MTEGGLEVDAVLRGLFGPGGLDRCRPEFVPDDGEQAVWTDEVIGT